jgi:hypothetical protein
MKLFKLFSVSALMLGAVAASNAQEDASFGVKGGVNFATINGGEFESPESRTSFHVGLLGEFPIADIFSIQVEALYSGQGFEYDNTYSVIDLGAPGGVRTENETVEYQLDYINVPVLAKFYLFKGFSLEAGPQFSFLINEEIDSAPNDNEGDTDTDNVETFDFGVAGGATFQTEMGLFATARYTQGITNIIQDSDENVTNSVFQLGIGYKF